MEVTNRLRECRRRTKLSAAGLAARIGVSRQTIHAMEAGNYVPNTAVSLRLARELGVAVEDLFALEESAGNESVSAELLEPDREVRPGEMLRLCRVGERTIAVPWSPEPFVLPRADAVSLTGLAGRNIQAELSTEPVPERPRLLVAGCDPAMSVLARHLAETSRIEMITVPCSSRTALDWLRAGKIHIAGTHLHDAVSGQGRDSGAKPGRFTRGYRAVTFAEWEEGFVVQTGNPKKIRSASDLVRRNVQIVSRPAGSGSRTLLDRLLRADGVSQSKVKGYERIASGHLSAAWQVRQGMADCCVATRIAASVFGLDFIPLAAERYDLVVSAAHRDLPAVRAVFDILQTAKLRSALRKLEGYETRLTGSVGEA